MSRRGVGGRTRPTAKRGVDGAYWRVFVGALVIFAALTHDRVFLAGNDASRFAQIEAVVDQGRTDITGSHWGQTPDRVVIGGKSYSNKPPLLSLTGALLYWVLKSTLGLSIARHPDAAVYGITLILVGGTGAWLIASFHRALDIYAGLPSGTRALTTAALALGTILTSFSGTLNNHTVAAALLFAACRAAWTGRVVAAGVWIALTTCVDVVPGLVFTPVVAYEVASARGRRALAPFAACLAGGAALMAAANWYVLGSPLLPKLVPGAIDQSSAFAPSAGGVLLPETWWYPLSCLLGWHGFFTVSPILAFGVAGMWLGIKRGRPLSRQNVAWLGAGVVAMILSHIVFAGSYGGWSYGFRYLIPIIPIVVFFLPLAAERVAPALHGAVLAVSILFALIGAYNPWPPAYEQQASKDPVASVVTNPVGANAAAWMVRYFPQRRLSRVLVELFVSEDPAVAGAYLRLFHASRGEAGPP